MKFIKILKSVLLILTVTGIPALASTAVTAEQAGITTLLGLFLLGLALNLTPCIYPMLAVTLAVFGSGKERNKFTVITRAIVYVLGIATMYSALGVAAAFTGGLFGGIMQSRTVLSGIGVLFILLALSMFGLWEIRPPASMMNRFSGKKASGHIGIYLSGLLVGIFAAPCIGPPVIALMTVVGQRGDPLFGFQSFFILSLGLGFPYLILALFSGIVPRLPRSGEWMIWVRKVLGVVLVSAGLFYISLAAGQSLALILIPAVLAPGGIYLGFIDKSRAGKKLFPWIKRIIGLIFIAAAIVMFRAGRVPSIQWQDYGAGAVDSPSVIYFSAEWCIPCLEMDIRTFTDTDVMEALSDFNLIKADLSRYESPKSQHLRQRYEIQGVPTIIFTSARGEEITQARLLGFVSAPDLIDTVKKVNNYLLSGEYEGESQSEEEGEPSAAQLVSDVEWIQPGTPFYIGMLFSMRDKWHVYWINPGDSGLEPRIEWTIPEGFTAGDIRWPYPQRFEDGPFATFGHEEYLLLSRKIIPPEDLTPGSKVRFEADASWLACIDICISQQGRDELVLEVRDEAPRPDARWKEIFSESEKSLPVKDPRWEFSFRIETDRITLYLEAPENVSGDIVKNSEFFPLEPGLLRTDPVKWVREGNLYKKTMRLEVPGRGTDVLKGVLVMHRRDESVPRALAVEALKKE